MESDNCNSRARIQPTAAIHFLGASRDMFEEALKGTQLIVDRDAKGHEGARGWVHSGRACPRAVGLGDKSRKPCRGTDRLITTTLCKFSRDAGAQTDLRRTDR